MSDSWQSHGLQHARLPCPSLSPRLCSNSCPLSRWCHPTISSSVIPFSSCPQSFQASGTFPMTLLFTSGGSISPSNKYSGFISFRITQVLIFQSSYFFALYMHPSNGNRKWLCKFHKTAEVGTIISRQDHILCCCSSSRNRKMIFVDKTWTCWRRKWQPTPVFLPGKSHGQRSQAGSSP